MDSVKKTLLSLAGAAITILIAFFGFLGWIKYSYEKQFLRYDDINKIQYAEPTEEAKNFDIEGYISNLPEVKYEKVDYKVKERYTYRFNDYQMTLDIPEGFEVKELPLKEKPKIVNSTSIEDSYDPGSKKDPSPANGDWIHGKIWVPSDTALCLVNPKLFGPNSRHRDECAIIFSPGKPFYKGISARDIFVRTIKHPAPDYKVPNKYGLLFLSTDRTGSNRLTTADILLDNNQSLYASIHWKLRNQNNQEAINLFFSILDTVDIQRIK